MPRPRYLNAGIAEQNMVGVAAGMAKGELAARSFTGYERAFMPMRVLDQIKVDVCCQNLPVVFVGDGAGVVYSHLGTSHQSTEDIGRRVAGPAEHDHSLARRRVRDDRVPGAGFKPAKPSVPADGQGRPGQCASIAAYGQTGWIAAAEKRIADQ